MKSELLNCITMTAKQLEQARPLCDVVIDQVNAVEMLPSNATFTATDGTVTVTAGVDSLGSAYCNVTGLE